MWGVHGAEVRPVTYVITEPCVDVLDRACIEECPVDCIYAGRGMLYIHPGECVDCGACEPVCPVEAIFYEDDVPSEWSAYIRANAELLSTTSDRRAAHPRSASSTATSARPPPWRAGVHRPSEHQRKRQKPRQPH
jgi:NAD-dependent dihydropyrimidine dehydrogenase PreA subunit